MPNWDALNSGNCVMQVYFRNNCTPMFKKFAWTMANKPPTTPSSLIRKSQSAKTITVDNCFDHGLRTPRKDFFSNTADWVDLPNSIVGHLGHFGQHFQHIICHCAFQFLSPMSYLMLCIFALFYPRIFAYCSLRNLGPNHTI